MNIYRKPYIKYSLILFSSLHKCVILLQLHNFENKLHIDLLANIPKILFYKLHRKSSAIFHNTTGNLKADSILLSIKHFEMYLVCTHFSVDKMTEDVAFYL